MVEGRSRRKEEEKKKEDSRAWRAGPEDREGEGDGHLEESHAAVPL